MSRDSSRTDGPRISRGNPAEKPVGNLSAGTGCSLEANQSRGMEAKWMNGTCLAFTRERKALYVSADNPALSLGETPEPMVYKQMEVINMKENFK